MAKSEELSEWTHAVAFTRRGRNLNSAHVEYAEAELISLAREIGRADLKQNDGKAKHLIPADLSRAERFVDDIVDLSRDTGLYIFQKVGASEPKRLFFLKGADTDAKGYETEQGFYVMDGATAREKHAPTTPANAIRIRDEFVAMGRLKKVNGKLVLIHGWEFGTPSEASCVLLGYSVNGRDAWKDEKGKSLKHYYQEEEGQTKS